jgi:cytidine deaminase
MLYGKVTAMPKPISSAERELLMKSATDARANAYAPYSDFFVGAAVLTGKGNVYAGCNVENSSYRITTCAEQSAIASAVFHEGKDMRILALAVTAGDSVVCSPCGACRQNIYEFGTDARIFFRASSGPLDLSISELLPEGFRLNDRR